MSDSSKRERRIQRAMKEALRRSSFGDAAKKTMKELSDREKYGSFERIRLRGEK